MNWPKHPHKLCSYPEEIEPRVVPRDYSLKVSAYHQSIAAVVRILILILSSAQLVGNPELIAKPGNRQTGHQLACLVTEQGPPV